MVSGINSNMAQDWRVTGQFPVKQAERYTTDTMKAAGVTTANEEADSFSTSAKWAVGSAALFEGIPLVRYLRNNNNEKNSKSFNTDINNNLTMDEIKNKTTLEKIMEEIDLLKKENCIKNEQIKNLQKDFFEQNQKLYKENQILKNELIKVKKN